jgi:hypothetical protein
MQFEGKRQPSMPAPTIASFIQAPTDQRVQRRGSSSRGGADRLLAIATMPVRELDRQWN